MVDPLDDTSEVKDTDIVFDCPHCSKSLAIDYRGAGLTIKCTDCGSDVVVPIPDGMELGDIDSTDEEQEIRIINLRRALTSAETRIESLEQQLAAAKSEVAEIQESSGEHHVRYAAILERVASIQKSEADIYRALDRISDLASEGSGGEKNSTS